MTKILKFDAFCSINEQDSRGSNKEQIYALIADGVSRAYGILGYFINIAQEKIDPRDWDMLADSIKKQKTYDGKWKQIINISKRLVQGLAEFSAEKYKDQDLRVQGVYDFGDESKPIPVALEKLKTASDILTKNLDESQKQKLLSLIDKSVSLIKPFSVYESLNERTGKNAPTPTEVLMYADNLRAKVINLKQTINNLSSLFPDSQLSGLNMMQKELDPMLEDLERILKKDFEPLKDEKLASSVKKFYSNKGWDVETSLEQYMVEAWEKLIKFSKDLQKKTEIVENFRNGVIIEYEPESNVKQYIDVANNILQSVEDSIAKRTRLDVLRKKSQQMIAGSSEWTNSEKKTDSQVKQADQLQDYLKKKYGK